MTDQARTPDLPDATRRRFTGGLAAAAALAGLPAGAFAQGTYPAKPIRLIVPFPPGESLDVMGRLIAERWGARLGQNIVVDNKPGAGGMIGTDQAAKATPDGYTVLLSNIGALAILPAVSTKVPYDVNKDLVPISQVANVPLFVFVSGKTPFTTVQQVVDYAKKNPGKLNFASTGIGSGIHLAGELFKSVTGTSLTHVPYKGVSQALPELITGSVELVCYPLTFMSQVKEGKLRALCIMSDKRSTLLPEVPTAAEAGFPKLIAGSWHAAMAPAGTPADIVRRLSETLQAVVQEPQVRERMVNIGADPVGGTPEQLARHIASEIQTWKSAAVASGAKFD